MRRFRLQIIVSVTIVSLSSGLDAQWVQTHGPYAGDNTGLAVLGSILFVGTYGGGVFLSTDNGTSWITVNTGLNDTDVFALALSGTNLVAGTDRGGVFLSTNNGASWTAVNSGLTDSTVRALTFKGTNLFAGTDSGIFLSTNSGASWVGVNSGLAYGNVNAPAGSIGLLLSAERIFLPGLAKAASSFRPTMGQTGLR